MKRKAAKVALGRLRLDAKVSGFKKKQVQNKQRIKNSTKRRDKIVKRRKLEEKNDSEIGSNDEKSSNKSLSELESTDEEEVQESEEEKDCRPQKRFKEDVNCATPSKGMSKNASTSPRRVTRSSFQQKQRDSPLSFKKNHLQDISGSGDSDLKISVSEGILESEEEETDDQRKPPLRYGRELRSLIADSKRERDGEFSQLPSVAPKEQRKGFESSEQNSSIAKIISLKQTIEEKNKKCKEGKDSGEEKMQDNLQDGIYNQSNEFQLQDASVNLADVSGLRKTEKCEGGTLDLHGRQSRHSSKARSYNSEDSRSSSNHEDHGVHNPLEGPDSEVTEIISDSNDCNDDDSEDDDVICLSPPDQLDSKYSNKEATASGNQCQPKATILDTGLSSGLNNFHSKCSSTSELGEMPAFDIISIINNLQESFIKMKQDFERQLREKDEVIRRLKEEPGLQFSRLRNELEWKTQQIEELTKAAERSLEIEAKINHLLNDREAYETEVQKISEIETNAGSAGDDGIVTENSRKRKRTNEPEETVSEAKLESNEADQIEEMLIGLKETPEDKLFSLEPVPFTDYKLPFVVHKELPLSNPRDRLSETVVDDSAQRKGRHQIRRLFSKLRVETKTAAILEAERRERVKIERLKHLVAVETDEVTGKQVCSRMVLAFGDEAQNIPLVEVDVGLLRQLKPHQAEAVEFMWDCVVESVERLKKEKEEGSQMDRGSGCILAHCMGLGKTLSVITLVHTLLKSDLGFKRCLIVSPLNAVLNWVSEWENWVKPEVRPPIHDLACPAKQNNRAESLNQWFTDGGILIISYSLFRILVSYRGRSKRLKAVFSKTLIDPGPDLIVCDEGHVVKNDSSAISKCLNRIATRRRIVLTGTPLQNNLIEYHCMVNFVRPNLLGTRQEFSNRFVNPITNGQHSDSTFQDVQVMKRRAHVLHQMLSGCIHRCDYSALMKFLPPKCEYVVSVRLSPLQIELYEKYLELGSWISKKVTGAVFFSDYQNLMRIWSHPWILRMEQIRQERKPLSFSDDDELESLICASSEEEDEKETETEMEEDVEQEGAETDKDELEEEIEVEEDLLEKANKLNVVDPKGNKNNMKEETGKDVKGEMDRCKTKKEKVLQNPAKRKAVSGMASSNRSNRKSEKDDIIMEEKMEKQDLKEILKVLDLGLVSENEKEEEDTSAGEDEEEKTNAKNIHKAAGKVSENEEEEKSAEDEDNIDSKSLHEVNVFAGEVIQNGEEYADSKNSQKARVFAGEVIQNGEEYADSKNSQKARVFAGEVIRNWQTKTRFKGPMQEPDDVIIRPVVTWWSSFLHDDDHLRLELSGKLFLLFEIFRMAEDVGDKVLVFSQSLLSLDLIEDFLKLKTEEATQNNSAFSPGSDVNQACRCGGLWLKDEDYVRMDGSTGAFTRRRLTTNFNDVNNKRLRLFLISTKAGGLGINLDTANRVVIFDASWNPSHDIQSIFRVYRFGQKKPVYIYRFLAQGTMEEKIYDRQVIKQTLSHRVLDEQQIERHFTAADLSELYAFKPDRSESSSQPTLPMPKDLILAELLCKHRDWIVNYHDHDSLLERRPEEDLSEEERKSAWEEYEKEKQGFFHRQTDHHSEIAGGLHYSKPSTVVITTRPPLRLYPISNPRPAAKENGGHMKSKIARLNDDIVGLVTSHIPALLKTKLNFQMSHLPRVIEEIIKYNPDITIENLQKRINAFVGIHTPQHFNGQRDQALSHS